MTDACVATPQRKTAVPTRKFWLMALGFYCLVWGHGARLLSEETADQPTAGISDEDENWQVIHLQGQRVGYIQGRTWTASADGEVRYWSESVSRMTIKRFGGALVMTVRQTTEEDPAGNLIHFVCDVDNPPLSRTTTIGRVIDDELHLTTTTGDKTTHRTRTWDPDAKSPVYQDRLLQEQPLKPGDTRKFRIYDPQLGEFAVLELRGELPTETRLLDGTLRSLLLVTVHHSLLPLVTIRAFLDDEGNTVKTETSLLGMESFTVSREEALKVIEGAELDLAVNTLVPVEMMADAHQRDQISYEVTASHTQLLDVFPVGPTQQVTPIDENAIRLTVTRLAPEGRETSTPLPQEYLVRSRFLDTDDASLIELAEKAVGSDTTDPATVAIALEKHVHREIRKKNFSSALATASEVADHLEGDCTEHAVLLAALLRIRGIPSRVAVGLVYSEQHSAFAGHMWTEAFLGGSWTPLDATIGKGGIGAAHIKVSDSALSDDGPEPVLSFLPLVECLGRIEIKVQAKE